MDEKQELACEPATPAPMSDRERELVEAMQTALHLCKALEPIKARDVLQKALAKYD